MNQFDGTTIVSVRNHNEVALGGDGQVSLGETIMKSNAIKVKRIYQDKVLVDLQEERQTLLHYLKNSRIFSINTADN